MGYPFGDATSVTFGSRSLHKGKTGETKRAKGRMMGRAGLKCAAGTSGKNEVFCHEQ